MGKVFRAPYFRYEDLRRKADEFLAKHHAPGTIPVPIEEIVEFGLGMDIVPTPGLHELLETDGFITSDLGENWDFAWSRIAAFLAKRFEVSSEVIERRLQKDEVPESFKH